MKKHKLTKEQKQLLGIAVRETSKFGIKLLILLALQADLKKKGYSSAEEALKIMAKQEKNKQATEK